MATALVCWLPIRGSPLLYDCYTAAVPYQEAKTKSAGVSSRGIGSYHGNFPCATSETPNSNRKPTVAGQAITAVCSKHVPSRDARMFKRGRVHLHAKALHYCARPGICGHCKRYDFGQSQHLEANLQSGAGGLRCKSLVPMRLRQSPQNLNTRRYWQVSPRNVQSQEANEFSRCLDLHRPGAPSTLCNKAFAIVRQRVTFLTRQGCREIRHDNRISVERRKRLAIFRLPLPQQHPLRFELNRSVHCLCQTISHNLPEKQHR